MTLDEAVTEVARARKRLAAEQGRLARKNARAAVKAAVATVLRAMDREYPLIRKEVVVRVSMSPIAKKRRERAKRMTIAQVPTDLALRLSSIGVKIISSKAEALVLNGPNGVPNAATPIQQHFAPTWVVRACRVGISLDEIQRAIRSRSRRERIEAAVRLRSQVKTISP